MIKIGIIGTKNTPAKPKVLDVLRKIKKNVVGYCEIYSGGNKTGVEPDVKKFALEFGFGYKEFNPSYSGKNMFSALTESYYGKNFHPTHEPDRYRQLIRNADRMIILDDGTDPQIQTAIKFCLKNNKKPIVIQI